MSASVETRLAVRRLLKRRAASAASIATLACAIATGAATWSLLSAVLIRPLDVRSPDRLVVVAGQSVRNGTRTTPYEAQLYPTFLALKESGVFDDTAGGGSASLLLSAGGVAERHPIYFASHNFFDVLGAGIAAGRSFAAEDDRRGAPLTAILSHAYWQSAFHGANDTVGKTITVGSKPVTIIGIAAPRFRGISLAESPDVYMPMMSIADVALGFNNYFAETNHGSSPSVWITVIGRMRRESTVAQTAAALQALSDDARRKQTLVLVPINEASIPSAVRTRIADFARLLSATVGLLLLIGGSTVGLLLLIRTEARRDEFAMCLALGATRARLGIGVVIEGALLSAAGALLALPLAEILFRSLAAFQLPGNVKIGLLDLSLDMRVVLAAIAFATASALLIALAAGGLGLSADTSDALRARSGASPRPGRRRTRAALVIAQVAVTLVLLAGAGLFGRSLIASISLNPGFETSRLVEISPALMANSYSADRAVAFVEDLRARLLRDPAVRSAAAVQSAGAMFGELNVDGVARPLPSAADYSVIDEHYFPTVGLRIISGRNFSADDRLGAPLAIIVSQSFGRFIANGGNPIGHRVTEFSRSAGQPFAEATVVGVVPDVITNVNTLEPLSVYYALAQKPPSPGRYLLVRAADVDRTRLAAAGSIREIDPVVSAGPMLTMGERISRQMAPQQFGALVLGVLGAIAALLTVLGAYVLAESIASLRLRETGIRAALGASRAALGGQLLWQTLRLVGVGIVAGFGLVWAGASTIRAFLFQVKPFDPATLTVVAAAILLVALAVSLRPALAAARVDLAKLLRED